MTIRCREPSGDASSCGTPVERGAPVQLCTRHLLIAFDWVARDVGVTDLLPAPCAACGSRVGVHYPAGWLCAVCDWRVGETPDADLPETAVHVVYYLRLGDRIKIGTSGNPRQRLRSIPHDELLAFERGDRVIERRRHDQFAGDREGTSEWFAASVALREHVDDLRQGIDDPWHRYARWRSKALRP